MGEFDDIRAQLEAQFGKPGEPTTPANHDENKISAAAARAADGSIKSLATPVRRGLLLTVALGIPLVAALFTPRVDLSLISMSRMVLLLTLHTGVLVAASWSGMRAFTRLESGPSKANGLVALAVGSLMLTLALGPAHMDHPSSLMGVADDFAGRALLCFIMGGIVGFLPLVAARVLDRGDQPWLGKGALLGGVGAGVAGNLYLFLHCPIVWPSHIFTGHITVLGFYLVLVLGFDALDSRAQKTS